MIFVFGSNLKGIHGAGAAKFAYNCHGARWRVGEGLSGNSYALPTKWTPRRKMGLDTIQETVTSFLVYAASRPDLEFKVTQVGCGLGGWTKEDIAPLFVDPPSNCYFDMAWREFLPADTKFWGSV